MDRRHPARMNDYDAIPYDAGRAFPETHPAHLATIGRLFGLASADPARARVLELGCGRGQNLLPMAWYLPASRFVGVELSHRQAADAAGAIRALGLSNAEILERDILELPADLGEFDYILAHGVYSWVPEPVREKMLALCAQNLAPHGIAYISYNTLPGWRRRAGLRDVLRYATRSATTPAERLRRAQEYLADYDAALAHVESDSARLLRQEIARVRRAHPSYLYHELLAEVNEPVLFSDFMARAAAHGLQYLGEAEVQTQFGSFFGPETEARLERLADLIAQEQYMDFLRNREFRATLLCRVDRTLEREIDIERFRGLAWYGDLQPREPPDLDAARDQVYSAGTELEVRVKQPRTKAALRRLAEVYPDSVAFDDLYRATGGPNDPGGEQELLEELVGLYVRAAVGLDIAPRRLRATIAARPAAHRLAQLQAAGGGELVTARHATLRLDPWLARLVVYLDGSRTPRQAAERLVSDLLDDRALPLPEDCEPDRARLVPELAQNCERLVARLARNGLLESCA
jgi:SAM-dependent methyltransferase